jgi:hypothetical protein
MNRRLLNRIDLYVIGWGVVISLGAAFFRDWAIFLGAAIGAVLAIVNWVGFRYAGTRFAATGSKARFGIFLAVKSALVFGAVALVMLSNSVDSLAFLIGLSALVLGVITRSVVTALGEGEAALEEER